MTTPTSRSRGAHVALAAAALLFALCTVLGRELRQVRAAVPPTEERMFVPTPKSARFLAAGYNELAADVTWARTLVYYGDGLHHGFSMQDVEPLVALVNALDPYFRRPYVWGAYATTFRQKTATQEEFEASVAILERGIKVFPQDWEMAWILGIRYYLDLEASDPVEARQLKELGASYIERAMRIPGSPPDLPTLAATLRTKLGQHDRALRELREMILTAEDGKTRDLLIARYERLSSAPMADALRLAKEDFDAEWKRELPYAPAALYVLVGSSKPDRSPEDLLDTPLFTGEPEEPEALEPLQEAGDGTVPAPTPGDPTAPSTAPATDPPTVPPAAPATDPPTAPPAAPATAPPTAPAARGEQAAGGL